VAPTQAPAATPTTAPAAAANPAAPATGKVVWWFQDGGDPLVKYAEGTVVPAWKKEHAGSDVLVQWVDWSKYQERLLTSFAAGTMADVWQPATESVPEIAALKQALPLDDLIKTAKYTKLSDFPKSVVDTFIVDGKNYGIAFRNDVRSFAYRKSHLKEKGLEPPKTWDDVIKLAGQLTIRNGSDLVRAGVDPFPTSAGFLTQMFNDAIWQAGGDMLTPDYKKAVFASPEGAAALDYLVAYHHVVYPQPEAALNQNQQAVPLFASGKISMSWGGVWLYNQVQQYAPDQISDVGVVNPSVIGSGSNGKRIVLQFPSNWSLSPQSKNPELAFTLIDILSRPDLGVGFVKLDGSVPVSQPLFDDPFFKNDEVFTSFIKIGQEAGRSTPLWPQVSTLQQAFGDAVTPVWFGKAKSADALSTAAAAWDPVLAKGWSG
jgi:multiple sugar transport system substrate-binding protein